MIFFRMHKKGASPLIATFLLVLCTIALSTFIMNLSSGAEESISKAEELSSADQGFCDPLTTLQYQYINNEISAEEYQSKKLILEQE